MADKKLLVVAFLFFCLLGVGAAGAVDALTITPTPVNGEFDFNTHIISVANSLAEQLDVRVYKNDAVLDILGASDLANGQSFNVDLSATGFVLDNYLRLEAFYDNGTFLGNTSVKINPQSPTFANFAISNDALIEGDNATFSIEILDTSALNESSVVATVGVNDSCTQAVLKSVPVSLTKTGAKYEYQNFMFEFPCKYSIAVNALDVYGNAGTSTAQTLDVTGLLCADLACLKNKIVAGVGDALDFDIISIASAPARYGIGKTYTADFDSGDGKFGLHGVTLSFADAAETKTIVSKEIATADLDNADGAYKVLLDMANVADLKSGFEVKITPVVGGKACFLEDTIGDKDFAFYCSGNSTSDCESESDWKIRYIENDCTKQAENIGSFFILATCNANYWDSDDDVCDDSIITTTDDNDDTTTTNTKKTTTTKDTNVVNTGGTSVFGSGGAETANTATDTANSEGGLLSGFGAFFAENTGTSVTLAIGILLAIGLSVFVIYRIRRSRVSSSSAPLLEKKEKSGKETDKKDRISIHDLAKRHDVHKPKNPKDANKLKEFLDVAMMLGHDPKDLSDSLKYRGWDPDMVDEMIKSAGFKDAKDA